VGDRERRKESNGLACEKVDWVYDKTQGELEKLGHDISEELDHILGRSRWCSQTRTRDGRSAPRCWLYMMREPTNFRAKNAAEPGIPSPVTEPDVIDHA
jgi:hypothetical protein